MVTKFGQKDEKTHFLFLFERSVTISSVFFRLICIFHTRPRIDFTKKMAPCAGEFYRESLDFHQTANLLRMNAHV